MVPIGDKALSTILSMAKDDIDRYHKLKAHLKVLVEREEEIEKSFNDAIGEGDAAKQKWEDALSEQPSLNLHTFGTLPWIVEEKKQNKKELEVDTQFSEAISKEKKAVEDLRNIREEKRLTLDALQEYHLEGWHCIIS